jgi:transcriptional regulator with XRE-family HTH domain
LGTTKKPTKHKIKSQINTNTLDRTKISDRIAYYRLINNISQVDMAKHLEMSQGNYGKIERADISIPISYLQKIAAKCKISVELLISDKIEQLEKTIDEKDKRIIQLQEEMIVLQKEIIVLLKNKR